MPRFAVALPLVALAFAACSFDANYGAAHLRCSDGVCPDGLVCAANKTCVHPDDGGITTDTPRPDGLPPALTCSSPGPATGAEMMGTTTGRSNTVSSLCGGAVYNAPDAVYRVDGPGSATITITSSVALAAYVLTPCTVAPATPSCETNTAATPGNPLTLSLSSGPHFVVVDGISAAVTGTYSLTITH